MTPTKMARMSLIMLLLIACFGIATNNNTAYAQAPAKKDKTAKLPPPPPEDPLVRVEAALDKLDKRLAAVEGDVATLKKDVASLKADKTKTDKKTSDLTTRVEKTESRITTLEKRPPLTLKAYKVTYKIDPPMYIYVRKTDLVRETYTYSTDDGKLYLFVTDTWVLVTK
jgi:septal ring factor EnvC (AmiA/AmiB activator)